MFKLNKYIASLFCALFFCMLIVADSNAQETERILNFHSDIKIQQSGRILVTETISVNVTRELITKGIRREIPIYQTDITGNKKPIEVSIFSVKRDGKAEAYSTRVSDNELSIYTGNEDYRLTPNVYEYTIQYESRGNIDFLDNRDEICWSVTGKYSVFSIDKASATVHLPQGAKIISNSCNTGFNELEARSCDYSIEGDSIVNFNSTTILSDYTEFIITTSFTPNIIKRPTPTPPSLPSKAYIFWHMYSKLILTIASLVVLISYLVMIYKRFYYNKIKPKVVPTFDPPGKRSAGSIRYMFKQKIDAKALTATILSLAVKKAITICHKNSTDTLTKLTMPESLTEDEKSMYNALFPKDKTSITLQKEYNSEWSKIYKHLQQAVHNRDKINEYYPDKVIYIVNGAFITIVFVALWFLNLSFLGQLAKVDIVIINILSLITILSCSFFKELVISLLSLIILIPVIIIQYNFIKTHGEIYLYSFVFIYSLVFIIFLFAKLFNPSTDKGLELTAELKGFEIYLKTENQDSLNFLTPPSQTLQQFEKMLPYAVALDLEQKWTDKFSNILKQCNYQPTWFEGKTSESYSNFIQLLADYLTFRIETNITAPINKNANNKR